MADEFVTREGFWRTQAVADRLRVTQATIYAMLRDGRLAGVRVRHGTSLRSAILVSDAEVRRMAAALRVARGTREPSVVDLTELVAAVGDAS